MLPVPVETDRFFPSLGVALRFPAEDRKARVLQAEEIAPHRFPVHGHAVFRFEQVQDVLLGQGMDFVGMNAQDLDDVDNEKFPFLPFRFLNLHSLSL